MTRRSTVPVRNAAQQRSTTRTGRASLVAVTASLACFSAAILSPLGASAAPTPAQRIASLKARAAQVLAQEERNGERISQLDEQYQRALDAADGFATKATVASREIKASDRSVAVLRQGVVDRAAALYRGAGNANQYSAASDSLQERGSVAVYVQVASDHDQQLVDSFKRAHDKAEASRAVFKAAESDQRKQAAEAAKSRTTIEGLNAAQNRLLASLNVDLKKAVTAEFDRREAERQASWKHTLEQRAAAEKAARDRATQNQGNGGGANTGNGGGNTLIGGSGSSGQPPPHLVSSNPRTEAAIQVALAQIGKSYVYAAAGPDHFDCSGLLVYAWKFQGVYLPHQSQAMYGSLQRIPVSQMQRGDFVYFGSDIHHVAMYLGGGMMVESPHTGAFVRTASVNRPDLAPYATRIP